MFQIVDRAIRGSLAPLTRDIEEIKFFASVSAKSAQFIEKSYFRFASNVVKNIFKQTKDHDIYLREYSGIVKQFASFSEEKQGAIYIHPICNINNLARKKHSLYCGILTEKKNEEGSIQQEVNIIEISNTITHIYSEDGFLKTNNRVLKPSGAIGYGGLTVGRNFFRDIKEDEIFNKDIFDKSVHNYYNSYLEALFAMTINCCDIITLQNLTQIEAQFIKIFTRNSGHLLIDESKHKFQEVRADKSLEFENKIRYNFTIMPPIVAQAVK